MIANLRSTKEVREEGEGGTGNSCSALCFEEGRCCTVSQFREDEEKKKKKKKKKKKLRKGDLQEQVAN
jgi:hypothetical protein